MVNVFGESVGSGSVDFQLVKKVVTTVCKFGDYIDEIRQSYEPVFTPYRLDTNSDGTFVTPIRVYDGRVYVSDDENTMQVTNRKIATDKISSKLIYFVEADDGSGVALQGDRGPSGVRGLKGDSGDQGPSGRQGPSGKRGAVGPEGPPGKIGKIGPPGPVGGKGSVGERGEKGDKGDVGSGGPPGPVGSKGNVGARGEKGENGNVGGAGPQGPVGPKGSTCLRGVRGVEGVRGVAGPDGPKGPSGEKAIEAGKARLGFKVLLEIKVNEASMGSVVSKEKRAHKVMLQML